MAKLSELMTLWWHKDELEDLVLVSKESFIRAAIMAAMSENIENAVNGAVYNKKLTDDKAKSAKEIIGGLKKLYGGKFSHPPHLLLGLIIRAQEVLQQEWMAEVKVSQEGKEITDAAKDKFELHSKVAKYALDIYEASEKVSVEEQAEALGVSEKDLLYTFLALKEANNEPCPAFALVVDHDLKALVLTVRGTSSESDCLVDADCFGKTWNCEDCPDEKVLVHGGMNKAASEILEKVMQPLEAALIEFPDYFLFTTGHSLGAGTAEVITMHLISHKAMVKSNKLHCVALAPPPVYRMTNDERYSEMEKYIDAYIFGEDGIPRCSIGNIARLVAMADHVDGIKIPKTHEYFYLKNLLGWHSGKAVDTLEDVKRRIEEVPVPAGYFLLRHPGAINYMYQEGEDYNLALGCKGEEFSGKLVLQHNMVTHHQAAEYRKAIEGVKVAFERD